MIFSADRGDKLSPALAAEAFDIPLAEAEKDFKTLLDGGALPLTLCEGDTLLCEGFALPMQVEGTSLIYLYSLVTAPKERGRGYLRTLLNECTAMAHARGINGLCLLPASQALAAAYRRMGFWLSYPIGAPAIPTENEGLALRLTSPPTHCVPMSADELRTSLPPALSPTLFEYALSTISHFAIPMRLDGVPALVSPTNHCALLAIGDEQNALRISAPALLLKPLGGRLPSLIPEPIPR